jgi:hypothetical protein
VVINSESSSNMDTSSESIEVCVCVFVNFVIV